MINISKHIDLNRCFQLIFGIIGIYSTFCSSAILHQWMIKIPFKAAGEEKDENFNFPTAFLIFPYGITWIIGSIWNSLTIQKQQKTIIPHKNAITCAFIVSVSTATYNLAIYYTNYPIVMMFKSCNLLSVVLVAVICSRVKQQKLKLGPRKIIIGIIISIGILMFTYGDQAAKQQKQTQILGLILLIISMLADGFLPDFQAEIKSVYKPKPTEMMVIINMWVAILSAIGALFMWQLHSMFYFMWRHPDFALQLLGMGVLNAFGQMFVYRMIKQFKQHFVPFVITTRKIGTVIISILFFKHPFNLVRIFGIIIVLSVTSFEFISELMNEKKLDNKQVIQPIDQEQNLKSEEERQSQTQEKMMYNK